MKKNKQIVKQNTFTEFLLYTTPNGKVKVEIFLRDETVWLTQDKIALLFNVQRPAITKHLKNIFESGELQENSVSSILEHTADERQFDPTSPHPSSETSEGTVKLRWTSPPAPRLRRAGRLANGFDRLTINGFDPFPTPRL